MSFGPACARKPLAAASAGLRVRSLSRWYDIDELADVQSLAARRKGLPREPAIRDLHTRIARVLKEYQP